MVRQFLPLLLDTITPHATTGGKAILAALEFLHRIERAASAPMHEAPLRMVTPAWWRLVVRPDKTIDRRAYTFCALQATHAAFKRHDFMSCRASAGVIRGQSCWLPKRGRHSAPQSAACWA